jgi:hypothetical protein
MKIYTLAVLTTTLSAILGCASGGVISGNDEGSEPVNSREVSDYQGAIIRCQKTGGSRIVKIEGQLRCF